MEGAGFRGLELSGLGVLFFLLAYTDPLQKAAEWGLCACC